MNQLQKLNPLPNTIHASAMAGQETVRLRNWPSPLKQQEAPE